MARERSKTRTLHPSSGGNCGTSFVKPWAVWVRPKWGKTRGPAMKRGDSATSRPFGCFFNISLPPQLIIAAKRAFHGVARVRYARGHPPAPQALYEGL